MRHGKMLVLALMLLTPPVLQASGPVRWSVGINVGPPVYRPWGYYPYGMVYRPYPVFFAPPPVIYEPAPVIIQRPVVIESPTYAPTTPTPAAPTPVTTVSGSGPAQVDYYLGLLRHGDEVVRRDAAMELGRRKVERAVDALAATLAGDASPAVRDAAARALGLIASPRALTALTHAAQADSDRDVRHSAQFAVEIIRSHLRRE